MSMCDDLKELGWRPVGPYASLADAAQAAISETFDAALVEINLNSEMRHPLVERLMDLSVPTALVTAYDEEGIPDRFKTLLLMKKPYSLAALASLLEALSVKSGSAFRSRPTAYESRIEFRSHRLPVDDTIDRLGLHDGVARPLA